MSIASVRKTRIKMKKAGESVMQKGGNALGDLFQGREELVPPGHFRFSNCSLKVVAEARPLTVTWRKGSK